jgi:2-keto-4-pentenoate hydratase/2-oxohepta-3-ene-1,7-dioic acid hydratase in catechol pathway
MKLATFKKLDGRMRVGELRNDSLYALSTDDTMRELAAGDSLPDNEGAFKVMKHKGIVAPIQPRKIMAVGRNYADHAAELQNNVPDSPLIFAKYPTSIIASEQAIQWSTAITKQVDWEGELVVVIGKGGRNIPEDAAYEHIFGYTIANDVSARDIQRSESQWVRAKAMDTFLPLGPAIITRDAVDDPHNLQIQTRVNDEVMQDASTADMVFKIPYLVHYLSQTFTLEPGDLILTGTPSGVGKGMNPPRFLNDGDTVSVTIEGIGTLTSTCQIID